MTATVGSLTTAEPLNVEEKKVMFLILLDSNDGNISQVCRLMGVTRRTYYNWIVEDEEFKASVADVREGMIDFTESKLLEAIDGGDVGSIKFFLQTQARHRGYGKKTEHVGPGGGPIQHAHMHLHKHYPPQPTTIEEWEKQVRSARETARRDAEGAGLPPKLVEHSVHKASLKPSVAQDVDEVMEVVEGEVAE